MRQGDIPETSRPHAQHLSSGFILGAETAITCRFWCPLMLSCVVTRGLFRYKCACPVLVCPSCWAGVRPDSGPLRLKPPFPMPLTASSPLTLSHHLSSPLHTQEASSPEGFTCVLTSATWMASFGGCTLEQEYCTCLPGGAYGLVGQADTSPPPNASRAGARQMEDSHIEIL